MHISKQANGLTNRDESEEVTCINITWFAVGVSHQMMPARSQAELQSAYQRSLPGVAACRPAYSQQRNPINKHNNKNNVATKASHAAHTWSRDCLGSINTG
jgi:hypothetical protein